MKKKSEVDSTERGLSTFTESCQARSLILSSSPALWSKMIAELQPLCSFIPSQPESGRGKINPSLTTQIRSAF